MAFCYILGASVMKIVFLKGQNDSEVQELIWHFFKELYIGLYYHIALQ